MTRIARALAIIAPVLILDRITKLYIQRNVSAVDTIPVIPGIFNIVHAENPGAAFSMLADAPLAVRRLVLVAASGAIMAVIGWMLFRPKAAGETALTFAGLALVLGGALGNFWDRVVTGTVTDFIQVFLGSYEYPSFNVADSAVFIGACCLIIDLWRGRRTAKDM